MVPSLPLLSCESSVSVNKTLIEKKDIFKHNASAAASEFCEWVQFGINVYIPDQKYQVNPDSSP